MSTLFRRRLIPAECIPLTDDVVVHQDSSFIITTWHTFRPKPDFSRGASVYVIDLGIKVSYFLHDDGSLCYTYCDIIDTEYNADGDTYTFTDLLADVIIYPDGSTKVVDLDELAFACQKGIISNEQLIKCLYRLDHLLQAIYDGSFAKYTSLLDQYV